MKQYENRKRRWGDRYDGFKIRALDPLFLLIPHIMRTRIDAQVYMEERMNISEVERFVREHKATYPELTILHVILASLVRLVAVRPQLNRFSAGGNTYARNYLRISLVVKEQMHDNGAEACLTPEFDVYDTLPTVIRIFEDAKKEALTQANGNGTDQIVQMLGKTPNWLRRSFVNLMRYLDSIGYMPKIINRVSPFHSSFYITSMGSLGIDPIYHHLYEFGTTSAFLAIGKKLGPRENRQMNFRFVLDERICDGYYYANSMKKLRNILKKPEQLLHPPETVILDEGLT